MNDNPAPDRVDICGGQVPIGAITFMAERQQRSRPLSGVTLLSSQTQAIVERFLDRLTMHTILSDQEQDGILRLSGEIVEVNRNRDFIRLGETVDDVCLVAEGVVGRYDMTAQGARQITALYIQGDVANLRSVVQPRATSAFRAISTTTLMRVPLSQLRPLVAKWPAIAEAFWRNCAIDNAILRQWALNVGRRNARKRLSHLLCEIACRLGADRTRPEVSFRLPMTQAELADTVALTPVHVNRTFRSLKDHGVAIRGGMVYIDDWRSLADGCEFNEAYLQLDFIHQERLRIAPLTESAATFGGERPALVPSTCGDPLPGN